MNPTQACAICEREPEDLLILSCQHNLCLNCATEIFILNGSNNPFVCEICLAETQLDASTMNHFQTERSEVKQSRREKKSFVHPPKVKSPKKLEVNKNYCQLHKEPALYYCFNCNSIDICYQCILTPRHANHKVSTIKKAMEALQKRTQEEIQGYLGMQGQLQEIKSNYLEGKKDIKKAFNSKKQQLKELFDEVGRHISQRFAQLCTQIQQQYMRVQKIYDACVCQITEKQRVLEQGLKIHKRAHDSKSQSILTQLMTGFNHTKGMLIPNLPKQMPTCTLELTNCEGFIFEISQILSKIGFHKEGTQQSIDYSVIRHENIIDQPIKTALKESYRKSLNPHKTQSKMTNSRKLEMSRSIQNAAMIINRLQERSAKRA